MLLFSRGFKFSVDELDHLEQCENALLPTERLGATPQ
jgi:hypothetical protein